jgi:hypothetical protein
MKKISGRQPFSPVDANKHASRGIGKRKTVSWPSNRSLASTHTAESFADDSEFDFLSKPNESGVNATLAALDKPATEEDNKWTSSSKTPRISNLTEAAAAAAAAKNAKVHNAVAKTSASTKQQSQHVTKSKSNTSTKVRFANREQAPLEQTNNAKHPGKAPLLPKTKRRHRKKTKKQDVDYFSIIERGTALDTIKEDLDEDDASADDTSKPSEEISKYHTSVDSVNHEQISPAAVDVATPADRGNLSTAEANTARPEEGRNSTAILPPPPQVESLKSRQGDQFHGQDGCGDAQSVNESSDMDVSSVDDLLEQTLSPPLPAEVDMKIDAEDADGQAPAQRDHTTLSSPKLRGVSDVVSRELVDKRKLLDERAPARANIQRESKKIERQALTVKTERNNPTDASEQGKGQSGKTRVATPLERDPRRTRGNGTTLEAPHDKTKSVRPNGESKHEVVNNPQRRFARQKQEPIDKQVWLAMMAKPEDEPEFPIGLLVATPSRSTDGGDSIDGSVLTQETAFRMSQTPTKTPAEKASVEVSHGNGDAIRLGGRVNHSDERHVESITEEPLEKLFSEGGDGDSPSNTMETVQLADETLPEECYSTPTKQEAVFPSPRNQSEQSVVLPTTLFQRSFLKPEVSSTSLSIKKPLREDVKSNTFAIKEELEMLREAAPMLWTTEHAGNTFKELGVNLAPIFRLKNGHCFRHPPLPPGWSLGVSRSRNIPFYMHPDFGVTFYCPVPLPSSDGNIHGATIWLAGDSPAHMEGMQASQNTPHTWATPVDPIIDYRPSSRTSADLPSTLMHMKLLTPLGHIVASIHPEYSGCGSQQWVTMRSNDDFDQQNAMQTEDSGSESRQATPKYSTPRIIKENSPLTLPSSDSSQNSNDEIESIAHCSRNSRGIPLIIEVVNQPESVTSAERFTMNLDATEHHRAARSRSGRSSEAATDLKGKAGGETDALSRSFEDIVETQSLESVPSLTGRPSMAHYSRSPVGDLNPKQHNLDSPAESDTKSSSPRLTFECADTFLTPQAVEIGSVRQKKRRSTPYQSKASIIEAKSAFDSGQPTVDARSPDSWDNCFESGGEFDAMENEQWADSPTPTGEDDHSPSVPTRVIVGGEDDMSHLQSTPVSRHAMPKISTRYKPTAIHRETSDDPFMASGMEQEQLENRTITSNGSMNSRSCNSNLSRASHRARFPSLPLCSLHNVVCEENGMVSLAKQKKRKVKATEARKKKVRRTKSVSVSSSDSAVPFSMLPES